jgi:hypothetical protein
MNTNLRRREYILVICLFYVIAIITSFIIKSVRFKII